MPTPRLTALIAAALLAAPALAQPRMNEAEIAEAFDAADRNSDGAVNVDEYVANVVRLFAGVDEDDDGMLAPADIPQVPDDRFSRADRDGDGMISLGEAVAERMILYFDLDTTRDGVLTLEEILAHERAVAAN